MATLKRHEGELMIDHRASVGLSDADMHEMGLPSGSGKGLFEAATYTCMHCKSVEIINHKRTRERAYCRGCDHYICDACGIVRALTGECRTFDQVADKLMAAAEKQAAEPTSILLLTK